MKFSCSEAYTEGLQKFQDKLFGPKRLTRIDLECIYDAESFPSLIHVVRIEFRFDLNIHVTEQP